MGIIRNRQEVNYSVKCFAVLTMLLALVYSCKKNTTTIYPQFKDYHLGYPPTANTNSLKLADGSFLILEDGPSNDSNNANFYLYKFDSHGNFITSKAVVFNQRNFTTLALAGNNFFISGISLVTNQFYVACFDANMDKLWDSSYAFNNIFNALTGCAAADGNILIAIGTRTIIDSQATFIAKINAATGALINAPVPISGIPANLQCQPLSIMARSDGVYICGYYLDSVPSINATTIGSLFCFKTTENGNVIWFRNQTVPAFASTVPFTVGFNIADNNTGAPVAATAITVPTLTWSGFVTNGAPTYNYNYAYNLIGSIAGISFDPSTGNTIDSTVFGIDNKAIMPVIHATADGGYIMAATGDYFLYNSTFATSVLLIKTDAHFNVQWQKKIAAVGNNYVVFGLSVLSDGYEIIGQNNYINNKKLNNDIFFIKTGLDGNVSD